jgi:hypothetical protein
VDPVFWLGLAAAYLLVHLAAYILVLRDLPAFSREKTIFLYHLISALAMTLVAVVLVGVQGLPLALGVALVAAHAIYSMTFLELWSLAEGGFSLTILRAVSEAERAHTALDLQRLHGVGSSKRGNRVGGMIGLGLARQVGDTLELTRAGHVLARALRAIAWPAAVREAN